MPPKGAKLAPPPAVAAGPLSPAAQQQKANSAGIADYELPKTSLTKLAKGSVGGFSVPVWSLLTRAQIPDNVKMQQDVVLALMRSSTVFISYLGERGDVAWMRRLLTTVQLPRTSAPPRTGHSDPFAEPMIKPWHGRANRSRRRT